MTVDEVLNALRQSANMPPLHPQRVTVEYTCALEMWPVWNEEQRWMAGAWGVLTFLGCCAEGR